ncbi:MAG: DUF2190 family protein [Hydrogenovibrio sp.]|uniref:DUF2190 family protein n=1 Tax=Hydrogenovibrio sp. TaxID=2065821 RepID=UPI002870356C|nr:DUF2190 family protein [Hydrogenovibrio sp.]MDR9499966.1 DUF2190 family protein [Hydrogenovibrio sp.]
MAKNYKSSGLDAVFTAAKDYQSGDMVKIGNLLGVTHDNVATGEQGVAIIEGVFALPKADGVALSQGEIVGYKGATGVIQHIEQPEDGDLSGAGVVVQDADAADDTVMLKINTGVGGSGSGKTLLGEDGVEVTVGSDGDFQTLTAAIKYLADNFEPNNDFSVHASSIASPDDEYAVHLGPRDAAITIKQGTVLNEQLMFGDGRDYGWINVVSEGNVGVSWDCTGLTRSANAERDSVYSLAHATNGSVGVNLAFEIQLANQTDGYVDTVVSVAQPGSSFNIHSVNLDASWTMARLAVTPESGWSMTVAKCFEGGSISLHDSAIDGDVYAYSGGTIYLPGYVNGTVYINGGNLFAVGFSTSISERLLVDDAGIVALEKLEVVQNVELDSSSTVSIGDLDITTGDLSVDGASSFKCGNMSIVGAVTMTESSLLQIKGHSTGYTPSSEPTPNAIQTDGSLYLKS